MKLSRAAWYEQIEKQRKMEAASRRTELEQIHRAQVPMEKLTHDENWDFFLSLLQQEIERCRAGVEDAKNALMAPDVPPEMLWAEKIRAIRCLERANAMVAVSALPKQILQKSKQAKETLRAYDLS